jgi:predicted RND superfamily exporter protein
MTQLIRFRWPALGLLVLLLASLGPGLSASAVPDNALSVWFLETDPQLRAYYEFGEQFGNDEVVLILFAPQEGPLSETGFSTLTLLSEQLGSLAGVEAVHSIASIQDAYRTVDADGVGTVHFGRAIDQGRDTLAANPLLVGRLLSADQSQAMLWVEMAADNDFDARRDSIIAAVTETTHEVLGESPHALGGVGVIYSGLNAATQHDFGLFVGLGYLVIFFAMGWLFRSWRMVCAAMFVVSFGVAVSLGIYGLAGHQLNMITVVLPTLIIVLGLADVVHFPTAFVHEQRARLGAPRREVVAAALRRVFLPCLMTSITTMAGFAALTSSPMAVIRHLGLYAALGVGAALLASVVVMAVALHSLPPGWVLPRNRFVHGQLELVKTALLERRGLLIGLALVLTLVATLGALRVKADTYTIGYLPEDHPVVVDHHAIEENWGPYSVLDFVVRPADGVRADSPEILAATEAFIQSASSVAGVGTGYGLPDIHRRLSAVLGIQTSSEAPLAPELVAQLNLVLELQDFAWDRSDPGYGNNVLAPWITEDGQLGRVTLVGNMASAKVLEGVLEDLSDLASHAMGDLGTIEAAGYPPLYTKIVDYAVSSQVRGFFLALGIIFCLMLLWLRSPRLALISLVPNAFPVLVMMGVMGALGIDLDIATATVAAIVVGVSIDDTVHFLLHWREAEVAGKTWEESVDYCFEHAGIPAVITTLLLVVGYPVLMLADVGSVVSFGLLTSVAAAAALFGDLILLPLLLRLLPGKMSR